MLVLDRSPDFGTRTMFIRDQRPGLSFSMSVALQNFRLVVDVMVIIRVIHIGGLLKKLLEVGESGCNS